MADGEIAAMADGEIAARTSSGRYTVQNLAQQKKAVNQAYS